MGFATVYTATETVAPPGHPAALPGQCLGEVRKLTSSRVQLGVSSAEYNLAIPVQPSTSRRALPHALCSVARWLHT